MLTATGPLLTDMQETTGLGVLAVPAVLAILLWNTRPADPESSGSKGIAVNFFSNRRAWLPEAAITLWVALIGAGLGACFSLTLTVALDHLSDPGFAGALTAFVQGIGFMITAAMPYLAGMLHEATGGFHSAWVMLLITLVMMLAATFRFTPSGYSASMGQLQAD